MGNGDRDEHNYPHSQRYLEPHHEKKRNKRRLNMTVFAKVMRPLATGEGAMSLFTGLIESGKSFLSAEDG